MQDSVIRRICCTLLLAVSMEKYMGTEVATELDIDLGGGLKLAFGGAYLFTGDFYKVAGAEDPDNLYEVFARLQLEF